MAANSKIEWTDHTWSPWRGCEQVAGHPACDHCYAMTMAKRNPGTLGRWGSAADGGTRIVAVEDYWKLPKKWNDAAKARGVVERVFVDSISDFFEDWRGPLTTHKGETLHIDPNSGKYYGDFLRIGRSVASMNDLRRRAFSIIDQCSNLIFMLLTKRPQNIGRMISSADDETFSGEGVKTRHIRLFRHNVWLGTTISNQETADEYIPQLLKCRDLAPVLFVSAEPLLGAVDLTRLHVPCCDDLDCLRGGYKAHDGKICEVAAKIDWLICGGESGHGARPMHPEWARSLRDQCNAAGVPFHFKQWGKWQNGSASGKPIAAVLDNGRVAFPYTLETEAALARELGGTWSQHNPVAMARVGKHDAGRELDGRTWDELPPIAEVRA